MWILALETASRQGSVALLGESDVVAERGLEAGQYASAVFAQTAALLDEHNLSLSDIGLFAVADGPGSFTGVRVGLTAVKGWIEVLVTPAVTVSTLRAAAGEASEPTLVGLDAGRSEVYYGVYPAGEEGLEGLEGLEDFRRRRQAAARWRAVTPDRQLQAACPEMELCGPWLAAAVGRLGLKAWRAGAAAGVVKDALSLDARYIRRPDIRA